jgi:hypothetical protein
VDWANLKLETIIESLGRLTADYRQVTADIQAAGNSDGSLHGLRTRLNAIDASISETGIIMKSMVTKDDMEDHLFRFMSEYKSKMKDIDERINDNSRLIIDALELQHKTVEHQKKEFEDMTTLVSDIRSEYTSKMKDMAHKIIQSSELLLESLHLQHDLLDNQRKNIQDMHTQALDGASNILHSVETMQEIEHTLATKLENKVDRDELEHMLRESKEEVVGLTQPQTENSDPHPTADAPEGSGETSESEDAGHNRAKTKNRTPKQRNELYPRDTSSLEDRELVEATRARRQRTKKAQQRVAAQKHAAADKVRAESELQQQSLANAKNNDRSLFDLSDPLPDIELDFSTTEDPASKMEHHATDPPPPQPHGFTRPATMLEYLSRQFVRTIVYKPPSPPTTSQPCPPVVVLPVISNRNSPT